MHYKQINNLQDDLDKIATFIFRLKRRLKDKPNDWSAEIELKSFESRYRQVKRELEYYNRVMDSLKFNARIFDKEDKNVDFNLKNELFSKIQNMINFNRLNLRNNELNLEIKTVKKGSVDLILIPKYEPQNFQNPLILEHLSILNKIIDCGSDEVKLKSLFDEIGENALIEYKNLLDFLIESNLNLELYGTVAPVRFNKKMIDLDISKKSSKIIENIIN